VRRSTVARHPSDGATIKVSEGALRGAYHSLCNRGSFIFWLPPYKLSRERMASISRNPRSFAFAIFRPIFLRISIGLA
jgi:hypothetical protein